MFWIFFALLAHAANGVVFVVDKSLLGKKSTVGKPLDYALYSAALAVGALVLLPFARLAPTSFIVTWSLIAGIVHIFALLAFFFAMQSGEPSRIVPITGSAVPFFTILFAVFFLGEIFTSGQGVGMALLIAGGLLLSMQTRTSSRSGVRKRLRTRIALPVFAGALFAMYFVITKYLYTFAGYEFLDVFMTSRVVEGIIALCVIMVLRRMGITGNVRKLPSRSQVSSERRVQGVFVANKVLAAGAFMLQAYAVSLGSVSVVNALQGVQYAAVFLLALVVSRFFPKLFVEETSRYALVQKMAGTVLISVGIAVLVL